MLQLQGVGCSGAPRRLFLFADPLTDVIVRASASTARRSTRWCESSLRHRDTVAQSFIYILFVSIPQRHTRTTRCSFIRSLIPSCPALALTEGQAAFKVSYVKISWPGLKSLRYVLLQSLKRAVKLVLVSRVRARVGVLPEGRVCPSGREGADARCVASDPERIRGSERRAVASAGGPPVRSRVNDCEEIVSARMVASGCRSFEYLGRRQYGSGTCLRSP